MVVASFCVLHSVSAKCLPRGSLILLRREPVDAELMSKLSQAAKIHHSLAHLCKRAYLPFEIQLLETQSQHPVLCRPGSSVTVILLLVRLVARPYLSACYQQS